MWRAVGLLLVALCMAANASLVLDTECPVSTKEDEVYYITTGLKYIEVKINEITVNDDTACTLTDYTYPVGQILKITPGVCDISCTACDAFGNCCDVKYKITVLVTCSAPDIAGDNGGLNKPDGEFIIGSKATYTCDAGHSPKETEIGCVEDGEGAKWSDGPPTCEAIECGNPPSGGEGVVLVDRELLRGLGATVTYSCTPGYISTGVKMDIVCEENDGGNSASWSAKAPTCASIKCRAPESGENVVLSNGSGDWEVGATVTYSCTPGYISTGVKMDIVCEENEDGSGASWSAGAPTCTPVKTAVGETELAQVRCPRGFTQYGNRCYSFLNEPDTWEGQCRKCKKAGGHLAVPHSAKELVGQNEIHSKNDYIPVWLGIHSIITPNIFMDTELRTLRYFNWQGKPSYRNPSLLFGPDCVSASGEGGKWTNECCYDRHAAICEADHEGDEACNQVAGYNLVGGRCLKYLPRPGDFEHQCRACERQNGHLATALNKDEGDSLNLFFSSVKNEHTVPAWFNLHDIIEEDQFQTIGLQDSVFFEWAGSGPTGKGDCVSITSDGWEDQCCYDEFAAICELNFCPKNYVRDGDNCFRLLPNALTWEAAEKRCRRDKTHLAVANTEADLQAVTSFVGSDNLSKGVWFGLHDQIIKENYQSPTLDQLKFFHWASTPRADETKDCGSLGSEGMAMECCYRKLPAVCATRVFQ